MRLAAGARGAISVYAGARGAAVMSMIRSVRERYGRIDLILNTAGMADNREFRLVDLWVACTVPGPPIPS